MNVCYLAADDQDYPALLKSGIKNPPGLYYLGDIQLLRQPCIGVVGSRRNSTYGLRVTKDMVSGLVRLGWVIVSGFMYGIDAIAHTSALTESGKTVAVLPCGVDVIHPSYQHALYEQIIQKKGLIISEFPPGTKPKVWTFPKRNKIVAGVSSAVLVTEAAKGSGTLITADFAQRMSRRVFVTPHDIYSKNVSGINSLINCGATCVTSARELVGLIDNAPNLCVSSLQQDIITALEMRPLSLFEICTQLGATALKVSTSLTDLQIKGILLEKEGRFYVG